jgi:hypothetical protein
MRVVLGHIGIVALGKCFVKLLIFGLSWVKLSNHCPAFLGEHGHQKALSELDEFWDLDWDLGNAVFHP